MHTCRISNKLIFIKYKYHFNKYFAHIFFAQENFGKSNIFILYDVNIQHIIQTKRNIPSRSMTRKSNILYFKYINDKEKVF